MRHYNCPEEAQEAYEAERAWNDEQARIASESAAAEADVKARDEEIQAHEEAMTNETPLLKSSE